MRAGALAMVATAALACRTSPRPGATSSCREIAHAGERWVAAASEATRPETLAVAAELIDLCQAPGLTPQARECVARAADPAAAEACPSVAMVRRGAVPPLTARDYLHGGDSYGGDSYGLDDLDDEPY